MIWTTHGWHNGLLNFVTFSMFENINMHAITRFFCITFDSPIILPDKYTNESIHRLHNHTSRSNQFVPIYICYLDILLVLINGHLWYQPYCLPTLPRIVSGRLLQTFKIIPMQGHGLYLKRHIQLKGTVNSCADSASLARELPSLCWHTNGNTCVVTNMELTLYTYIKYI